MIDIDSVLQRISRYVDAGEARLNVKAPDWWQEGRVDTDNLFMASLNMCLLAQLHNEGTRFWPGTLWGSMAKFLGDDVYESPSKFGFDLSDSDMQYISFEDLAEEWIKRIMRRRGISS